MDCEILRLTPIAGGYKEKHFGVTDSHPLWVQFNPIDSESWIGSFAGGETGLVNEKIVSINQTHQVGILTNGSFYLIEIKSQESIFHPEFGHFVDFEIIIEKDLIILATNWEIIILKNNKHIKSIRPNFIDGIRFTNRNKDLLLGEMYQPEDGCWIMFELDINTLKLKWQESEY